MTKKTKNNFNIIALVNNNGCFDLQFRKDIRHERVNSPTYYRWKAQFVVISSKEDSKVLEKIKDELRCGKVSISNSQARFSVQKISDISGVVVPFFRKNLLADKKKKDFELWSKAVEIIQRNKGKYLASWKKNDLCTLIEIHKSSVKYKNKPRQLKWLEIAKALTKIT